MATKTLDARLVLEYATDTGESPATTLDTDTFATALTLSGFKKITAGEAITLAVDADDEPCTTLIEAIGIILVSRDYAFSVRLNDGETLIPNTRLWMYLAADEEEGMTAAPLLTGNGENICNIDVWKIEKP